MPIDYSKQLPDNGGYQSAINYYRSLKQQFLRQVLNNFQDFSIKQVDQWSKSLITQASNAQFTTKSGKQSGETAVQVLNKIYANFATNSDIQQMLQQAKSDIAKLYKDSDLQIRQTRAQAIQDIMLKMNPVWTPVIQKSLVSVIENTADTDTSTLHDLVNRANQMFRIALSAELQGKTQHILTGWPMRTMQGYLREQSELNALENLFKDTPVKVTHGGSKKVNNVETVFDNILSFIDFNDDAFSKQVQGTSTIGLTETEIESAILPQIKFYGEQVKSFNLLSDKVSAKNKMAGHRIASNEALFSTFMNQVANANYITLKENLAFMAKYQHILEVFGPATLLFSSGAGRQWMHEFIQNFRQKNYYLLFSYRGRGAITSTIELNQPLVISRKTGRTVKNTTYSSTSFT